MELGVTPRRHNPVDSICRKLQTIQRRDQEANLLFPIPKFQSSSYDSPQSGLRHNLEAILKKRAIRADDADSSDAFDMRTPTGSPRPKDIQVGGMLHLATPVPTPSNATYTITSTLGERRCTTGPGQSRLWQRTCSTPNTKTGGDGYFTFNRCPPSTQPQGRAFGASGAADSERLRSPTQAVLSYNLNFCSSDTSNLLDSDLGYPALVVKRLSMGDELKKESMAEVSLICEEDLLDTIFHACDTQRRGKVYVSRIVDYLRHTTSRTSEDSGLEELCNMLDPEHKDISIDLDTYHAIMKEWIEDCRNQGDDTAEDLTEDSVKVPDTLSAKRSTLLSMTSGSLEAFGGEVSRADLETSDLVYCVADLQLNNQKLQEEVRKLKQTVEAMEETNQKLMEENEDLKTKAKIWQHLLQKEKLLKEEVEEMKISLSSSEESRVRASAQTKQMERENQGLIMKISSLQEENIKVTAEIHDLQKKMGELCDLNTDLQVQIHSSEGVLSEKDSVIQEKNSQLDELKAAIEEYSSVTELLRAEKSKLENQVQMMQPDMRLSGLSLSVAYQLNQTSSGSLQTELALAQSPLEGVERLSGSMCLSPLDETLDREVLLLMQGPTPEQMSLECKSLIRRLHKEFKVDALAVLTQLQILTATQEEKESSTNSSFQSLRSEVEGRRQDWAHGLEQLEQYTASLEKELLKMASNMRRSRTEILHLSVRVQEQENQKRQLCEELDQLKTPQDSREVSCQTPDLQPQVEEELNDPSLEWEEENVLPESPLITKDSRTQNEEQWFRDPPGTQEEGIPGVDEKRLHSTKSGEELSDLGIKEQDLPLCILNDPGSPQVLVAVLEEQKESPEDDDSLPECNGHEDAPKQAVCTELSDPAPPSPSHTSAFDHFTFDPNESCPTFHSPESGTSAQSLQTSCQEVTVLASGPSPNLDKHISSPESSPNPEAGEKAPGDAMSNSQSLLENQLPDSLTAPDRSSLLPVVEEEETAEVAADVQANTGPNKEPMDAASLGSSPTPAASNTTGLATPEGSKDTETTPDLTATDGSLSSEQGVQLSPGTKKDSLNLKKLKKEMSHSMEAIEEQKGQEDSDLSTATEKEDAGDSTKEDKNGLSQNDKEIEAEFHRLSLGFKCDIFTLEKRLRLEERSRDLAEDNVRREVSSCQGLLQNLILLYEEDNKSMEIIQRLQKNLDILTQSMTRVASRSEMLGAIHQESRTGKSVEVMIQHVENLRRMYTKEHAELVELRETIMQNERSFGAHTDEFRKKSIGSYYKPSTRRVSMPGLGVTPFDLPKSHEVTESEVDKLSRRWKVKSSQRPPLKRFVSSGAWADTDEPSLINRFCNDTDPHSEEERKEEPGTERKSSLTELSNKIASLILPLKPVNPSPNPTVTEQVVPSLLESRTRRPAAARYSRSLWVWVALVVVLAVLLTLLASLVLQPAVDAAPVGTGDSWMTIQQLLWPYTGLRHNGQPPV
ncbi:inositol 1,4,5-triphosphate receptor associated 2 isoform X2 [Denticeps clupeoides]|uniref:inositol 1,4,5-triphosphate receptor associated 2 isoform X2 n=1 Tax=Denticeps clupeoides TaxID=299321 RepID=UPI0010A53DC7|nr:lymphoid-restricted membrane protein-like isoform X2 [Denticeps clupeoides]